MTRKCWICYWILKCADLYHQISTQFQQYTNSQSFAKDQKITAPVYYHLKCDKDVTPKIYGLPKIHKESVPLRSIVSFTGSLLYNLSTFLVDI